MESNNIDTGVMHICCTCAHYIQSDHWEPRGTCSMDNTYTGDEDTCSFWTEGTPLPPRQCSNCKHWDTTHSTFRYGNQYGSCPIVKHQTRQDDMCSSWDPKQPSA